MLVLIEKGLGGGGRTRAHIMVTINPIGAITDLIWNTRAILLGCTNANGNWMSHSRPKAKRLAEVMAALLGRSGDELLVNIRLGEGGANSIRLGKSVHRCPKTQRSMTARNSLA